MKAEERVRELVKDGRPWPLALHIAAQEYGTTPKAVAARLGHRRASKRPTTKPKEAAWWDK